MQLPGAQGLRHRGGGPRPRRLAGLGGEAWGALLSASADGSGGRFPYLRDTTPSAPGGLVTAWRELPTLREVAELIERMRGRP